MNLERLFMMQKQLDERIETKRQLKGENLVSKKILALLVEIGELANETRCFKFWSSKPPAPREKVIEEYVDGLHFILSLGIDLKFADHVHLIDVQESKPLVEQFLCVFQAVHQFERALSLESYQSLLDTYLQLAHALCFTLDEVEQAYIAKNEVNHERQNQNY
ncbi:dimeric dUTPase (all-alpha-NTP-PPase superfamily) [Thermolongibacillus altinsuensis]|jgi:dimeric dUTPase (all-alpha-NTP-PPase superfamily)|uniref:Dimeric dUTPase (All-alpha-NTP-PPase superfamily) n=1 Tax=Thermolongibacillus altinsuensis TaxID=575256 RepID=A0A4V2QAG2_9BACL|nr:dUTP diphosphatase [Thermolongibacillus altinsuensis]TCL51855.1 dimeric dUTPase (all-alpha-NTP-PPase superfamily) [Thermolongibacillus altinsuensis]